MNTALGLLLLLVVVVTDAHLPWRPWGPWNGGHGFGGGLFFGPSRPTNIIPSKQTFDDMWTSTGTVPDKLSRVPDQPLYIDFGGLSVTPNMTIDTSQLIKKPNLRWIADPNALYTLVIEDNDITSAPIKWAQWLVTNIPGNDVKNGEEIATYVPSFHFTITNGQLDTTTPETSRHLVLIYKQKGRIDMSGQAGCNNGFLEPPRITDHDQLQATYNLEGPIAGNFYRVKYSQGWTEYYICYLSKCIGAPYPLPIPGVNDNTDCPRP